MHGAMIFKCDHCNKTFSVKGKLNNHLERVHGPPDHKCAQCNKGFTTSHRLTKHIIGVHERPHLCNKCNKVGISEDMDKYSK